MRFLTIAFASLLLLAPHAPLAAQGEVPSLRWKTIRTEHFRIHYEPQLEAWATDLASKIESVRDAVAARVGYTPPQIIDLIVEDPLNVPNGSAIPVLTYPSMRFWATPPAPTSGLGGARGWGEILSVHEYAHLAHLLRPSRKPLDKLLATTGFLPFGPITGSPAWVAEGYATVIEGELSGAGRPNGVSRAATLRTLALEGYLPSYGELDATDRFNGGAMRYLMGSAYLEWLQAPRGDSVLPHLWRRATSRVERDFDEAFKGTFGDAPNVMYGEFTSELTRRAHEARVTLERRGLARGTLVQRWTWGVGSPAISPDGKFVALRRASPEDGSRVLVYALDAEPLSEKDSTARAKAREKRFTQDPEDLPDVERYPAALKDKHTLAPVGGQSFDAPRWFRDGKRLLVTRSVPRPDGRARPDLFEWSLESGAVRRVTRTGGIMLADPLPDGSAAIALTCGAGSCDVVRVDLTSGSVSPLAAGAIDRSYHGVRVSPDGKSVASARQRGAAWFPVVIDLATGAVRAVGPDDNASRYAPTWDGDTALIVMSEAEGVATLERISLTGGTAQVVARSITEASSPDVGPDGRIWWLEMHGRGDDLRVNDGSTALPVGVPLDPALFPAVRRVETRLAVTFDSVAAPTARPYGIGRISGTWLATSTTAADGQSNGGGFHLNDVLGRLNFYALAGDATQGAWAGWRTALTWRGLPPALQLQAFGGEWRPSAQARISLAPLDQDYRGWLASVSQERAGVHGVSALRIGYSGGTVSQIAAAADLTRDVRFATLTSTQSFTPTSKVVVSAGLRGHYSAGSTGAAEWSRTQGSASLAVGTISGPGLGLRAHAGRASTGGVLQEQFIIGGAPTPFVDDALLDNRITHLGLPAGARSGNQFAILTAEIPGPLRVFHDWIAAGTDELGGFTRVVGAELGLDIPRFAALRVPAGILRLGVSHVLHDARVGGTLRNTTVGYSAISFTP